MIEYISPSGLKENPENPRTITPTKFNLLVKSIKEFPQMLELRPLVVDDELVVLGGNMRLKACIEAGLEQVPYIKVSNMTEEQKKEFIIKDNVGYGEWDWDVLKQEWNMELLEEWGMDTIKHDWNQLDFIDDEQALPETSKVNTLVVVISDDWIGEKDEIRDAIKDFIDNNYNGCEVK